MKSIVPVPIELDEEEMQAEIQFAVESKSKSKAQSGIKSTIPDAPMVTLEELRTLEHRYVWLRHYLGPNYTGSPISDDAKLAMRSELRKVYRLIRANSWQITRSDQAEDCNSLMDTVAYYRRFSLGSTAIEVEPWPTVPLESWVGIGIGVDRELPTPATKTPICSACESARLPGRVPCNNGHTIEAPVKKEI